MTAKVVSVALSGSHDFSKQPTTEIEIVADRGVRGDAHFGATVQHRSRVAADPTQPNLRQVHLIHAELLAELAAMGFAIGPAALGENITTQGIDPLGLPRGAVLCIGSGVRLQVTGLRNPCAQIEAFQSGLLAAVLDKCPGGGGVIRKSGVMAVAAAGGIVRPGDEITIILPPLPFLPLERV